MNKIIKRFLKLIPGGREFIKSHKDILSQNQELRSKMNKFSEESKVTDEDYKVFFRK